MSGLEPGWLIREHHPEVPIILASGYRDKAAATVNEGFTLIRKPYSPEALGRVLNSTLSEARE
jgi:two-component system, NtrC family, sensor kinase